jgi:hypothetical protein
MKSILLVIKGVLCPKPRERILRARKKKANSAGRSNLQESLISKLDNHDQPAH